MTWAILMLPGRGAWSPDQILGSEEAADWPLRGWPLIAMQDLAEAVITPDGVADQGQPVVTPRGLSLDTGQVLRTTSSYSGRVYVSGSDPNSLGVGDLLIPRNPSLPALVVTENHAGLRFAGSFHCLRMSDTTITAWLWAILSSKTGQRVRQASSEMSGNTVSRGRLLDLAVPMPILAEMHRLVSNLQPAFVRSGSVDTAGDDVQGSWWRVTNLPGEGRWDVFITFADPEAFFSGVTLDSLCESMATGRAVNKAAVSAAVPGWLPVYTSGSIRAGGHSDLWVSPSAGVRIAEVGDVLIPGIGLTALSVTADRRAAVSSNVLQCRPREQSIAEILVRYLNSDRGQAIRRTLVAGVIPRLTLRSAKAFPVPADLIRDNSAPGSRSLPLGEELDDLLWN